MKAVRYALLMLALLAALYPVLWVVQMAVSAGQGYTFSLNPFRAAPSLDNLRDVVGQPLFWRQAWNSVVISAFSTVLGLVLAATAAYAFSRFKFPGHRAAMLLFLVSQMVPGAILLVPLYVLLDKLGLLDARAGLVLVYASASLPFAVWNLKGYFDTIPVEIEEAALVDGASRPYLFWRVVLPLARPALAVTALFAFLGSWNEFILAATLLSDERMFTLPVVLQRYVGAYSTEWGHFAAGALVVSLPSVALFYALQRHLVSGLTGGALKG